MRLHRFSQNITKTYELKNATEEDEKSGYTLSGMDRDSIPDFFIRKRGHLLSPRYTINSPQKS